MKIKLSDIVNGVVSINALQEIKLPVKISYRLKRLVDRLTPILKNYDEQRNELIKKLGEKDEEKDTWNVKKENLTEFYAELQKVLEIEEDIEWEKIKIDELGDVKIEPKLLLDFIFE